MESFTSPFGYFVFLNWSFFILGLVIYLSIFFLSAWKDFYIK